MTELNARSAKIAEAREDIRAEIAEAVRQVRADLMNEIDGLYDELRSLQRLIDSRTGHLA